MQISAAVIKRLITVLLRAKHQPNAHSPADSVEVDFFFQGIVCVK